MHDFVVYTGSVKIFSKPSIINNLTHITLFGYIQDICMLIAWPYVSLEVSVDQQACSSETIFYINQTKRLYLEKPKLVRL